MVPSLTGSGVMRRSGVMWVAARTPRLTAAAMAIRWVVLMVVGAPFAPLIHLAAVQVTDPGLVAGGAGFAALAGLEWVAGGLWRPLGLWRKGWATKRLWPSRTAAADYGTENMRASLGGGGISNFNQSTRNLPRPVLNHPPLGWRPRFDWTAETVSWRVWPPGAPGAQTTDDIEQMRQPIIDGFNFLKGFTITRENLTDPWATITFSYADIGDALAATVEAQLDHLDEVPRS